MFRIAMILFLMTMAIGAGDAAAQSGLPFVGQIEFAAPGGAIILLAPDGSGPTLGAARDIHGELVDASLRVRLVDFDWQPVVLFPHQDLWLQFEVEPGTVKGCVSYPGFSGGVFLADGPTGWDGWATFSLPLRGGGWSSGACWVYLNGSRAFDPNLEELPPLPLRANSADIDGSLVVNLADVSAFAQDLLGAGHFRSDLHPDGVINLVDVSIMARYFGVSCE